MYEIFIHQWKEKVRSPFGGKNILLNIFLCILGLYLMSTIVFVSLFADKILLEVYSDRDVVATFTGLLFYYFCFDIILRFLFQQLPTISIQPYLTLPIKKSLLLHYPIIKSVTSFFNGLAVLLILPFFIKHIIFTRSFQFSFTWLITMLSIMAVNNFFNFSLKKYFSKKPLMTLLVFAVLVLMIYFDFVKIYSFSNCFSKGVYFLSRNANLIGLPVLMVVISYYFAYTFLKKNAYIEDIQNKDSNKTTGLFFLDQYGEIGQLINLELKMILRNKRPKSLIYVCCIFLLYGFLFYRKENLENYLTLSLMGLLLPSMFSINYGQYLFSWESSFFDFIIVHHISVCNYVKSKHIFFTITSILGYLIVLPYAFISYKIALINAAFLLFNIGITSLILLFVCTFNSSYIDLGKGQFMNYQGTSATQFLIILPIMGIPFVIYLLCKACGGLAYYYYVIAIFGFIGIISNKYLLNIVTSRFLKRKYKMALGFRQK